MKEFFIIYRDQITGSEVVRLVFGKSLFDITELYKDSDLDIIGIQEINFVSNEDYILV